MKYCSYLSWCKIFDQIIHFQWICNDNIERIFCEAKNTDRVEVFMCKIYNHFEKMVQNLSCSSNIYNPNTGKHRVRKFILIQVSIAQNYTILRLNYIFNTTVQAKM